MKCKISKDGRMLLKWSNDKEINESNIILKEWFDNNTNCKLIKAYMKNMSGRRHVYINSICECGNEFTKRFNDFKRQKRKVCNKCLGRDFYTYDDVVKLVRDFNKEAKLKLLSEDYKGYDSELVIEDKNGYKYSTTLHNLIIGKRRNNFMEIATVNNRFSIYNIKKFIELTANGYELLSDVWEGNDVKLKLLCDKKHEIYMTWNSFKNAGSRCLCCYLENKPKGENHPNWKGGTSEIGGYVRDYLSEWKNKCKKECKYKCVITGLDFDEMHHLTGFNSILLKVLNDNDMKYDSINGYSQEEINFIKDEVLKMHEKVGGVCLNKIIHKLFHSKYGLGDNTYEQFILFIKEYFSGEYDGELEDKFKSINSKTNYKEAIKIASFYYAEN